MAHIILHITTEEMELARADEPGNVGLWVDNDCLVTWKPEELGEDVPLWLVHRAFDRVYEAGKKARSKEILELLGGK